MTEALSATQTLARFITESRFEALPEALRHEGRRSILNHVGCALGVARDPAVRTALEIMRESSGKAVASVYGQREKLGVMEAAFVNAIASNLLDYDDTHLRTVIHPSAPVAPAVFALAEETGATGAEVLHAFLLGGEVACRIGNAVSPGHYARGWHITASTGVFGAAAAAARLLRLSAEQTADALGIAASQSGSIVENLATAAKNIGVGNAARNGILAARFAARGYRAAPLSIEGPLGWARAMGDEPQLKEITEGLGQRWEIARNTYKPYAAGIVFHAVIDACLELRETLGAMVSQIARVTVAGDALLLARGDRVVRNERDTRVSIHHCAAIALALGRADVADFEMPAVQDAELAALRAKVVAECDASLPRGAARVTITLADGSTHQAYVEHPRGSAENPLSDAELAAKYRANAVLGGMTSDVEAQIAALWALDQAPSTAPIMALLRGVQ
ncbi:MAG: MmgE/PrpD family protein [Acetobacteraceae bacterium]|nr:MmgE/PrpD family protein [Acetobacteraceae bacterium]